MIAIIGGGVFGLAIGWYLARAGRSVTIFEKGQAGQRASWAAAGMLMPWKLSPSFSDVLFAMQQQSHQQWPAFAAELTQQTGTDLDYQQSGRYFVTVDDKAAARLHRQFQFHQQHSFPVKWLDAKTARRQAPYLGPAVTAAIYTPLAHVVDNRRLVAALIQAFQQAGGQLREQTAVQQIITTKGQLQGLQLAAETIPCDTAILAAGAWSDQLAPLPHLKQPLVKPRKGQTLMLQMDAAAPLIPQPLLGPVYLVPRSDGRLIVGTTVEREAGFNTETTASGLYHILRKARTMVPAVDDLPVIETTAGLRPTSPERLPVLGPSSIDGLHIATGGHSYGILLTPLVAHTLSHSLLSGQPPTMLQPFWPNRLC